MRGWSRTSQKSPRTPPDHRERSRQERLRAKIGKHRRRKRWTGLGRCCRRSERTGRGEAFRTGANHFRDDHLPTAAHFRFRFMRDRRNAAGDRGESLRLPRLRVGTAGSLAKLELGGQGRPCNGEVKTPRLFCPAAALIPGFRPCVKHVLVSCAIAILNDSIGIVT